MLAGLGDVVAEALHDLKAHHVAVLFGDGGGAALDLRVQILAVPGNLQQPGLMVDARDLPLHLLVIGHVQMLHQPRHTGLHAVAQAHGLDSRVALHGPGEHGHGVGVVQEPGVGADLLHVMGEVHHHRDGAQRPEDAADAQGVGDSLAQAVLFRHLKVGDGAGLVQAHLDGVDHVIGPAQGGFAVLHAAVFLDAGAVAQVVVDGGEHQVAFLQPLGINVVQGDGALRQRGGYHAVPQHILGKHRGTGAHEGNLRHTVSLPSCIVPS